MDGFRTFEGCNFRATAGNLSGADARFYYLKDHLGSIRMTVDATGTNTVSYDNYYPFGLTMPSRSMVNVQPKWRFTGKEKSTSCSYSIFHTQENSLSWNNSKVGLFDGLRNHGDSVLASQAVCRGNKYGSLP